MTERVEEKESGGFILHVPRKLFDPFSDLWYFHENRPVFFYEPFDQWFVFGYDDVANLFHDSRLSADRMKEFVDAAPPGQRGDVHRSRNLVPTAAQHKARRVQRDRMVPQRHKPRPRRPAAGLRRATSGSARLT